ncbi:MAG: winged helix-turn-helix transcriptional regulator [bacterium]
MRMTLVAVLALGLSVALAAPAMAADGTIRGHAAYPFQITGAHTVSASDGDFLLSGKGGTVTFTLKSVDGTATRVLERSYYIADTKDPSARVLWQQKVDRRDVPLAGVALALASDGREDAFQILAYAGPAKLVSPAGQSSSLVVGANAAPVVVETPPIPADVALISQQEPFSYTVPAGLTSSHATVGDLQMNGAMKLFVTGAHILSTSDASGIPAYERDEQQPGQAYDPVTNQWRGPGSHTEHIKEYLVVEAKKATFALHFSGPAGLLYAKNPAIAVDGQAVLKHMEGTVTITDKGKTTTHTLRGEDLTLGGRFTITPHDTDGDASATQVSGQGDITTVSYGSVSAHYDWATAIAAVGLGAAAIAAIAWAVANGKTILGITGGGIVAGYARVQGDGILEHAGRAEVYERVKAFPGVNFVQLSEQVEFGTSTLNYHLRVLEKNGFVISVRDGRYLRFFDRKSGHYSSGKKLAVSALRNDKTAAIAQHIRANPGIAQCDLAEAFGVTASTVTWHINRLAGAGLVQKTRDAHRTRYFLGDGWASLPADEQVRQGVVEAAPTPVVA